MKEVLDQVCEGTNPPVTSQNNKAKEQSSGSGTEDEQLVSRCRGGDMAAFGRLIEKYQHRLFNTILRTVGNYDDAQELTQEAFVRAMQAIKKFRGSASFYTWLFRIGMNLSINHHRRRQRVHFASLHREEAGGQAEGLVAALADTQSPSPLGQSELKEEYHRVLEALDDLEAPARAVVVLRDIEELNYDEISRILEVPIGTVKSRLFRARNALRAGLLSRDDT